MRAVVNPFQCIMKPISGVSIPCVTNNFQATTFQTKKNMPTRSVSDCVYLRSYWSNNTWRTSDSFETRNPRQTIPTRGTFRSLQTLTCRTCQTVGKSV